MKIVKVEGNNSLARDLDSNAIINIEKDEYNNYLKNKEKFLKEKNEKEVLKNEINNLKQEVQDIKALVLDLIKVIKDDDSIK